MSRLAYITAYTPFSRGETFVLNEILALKEAGNHMLIIPRDKVSEIYNEKAKLLFNDTLSIPLFDFGILKSFLRYIVTSPLTVIGLIKDLVVKANSAEIALKNLAVIPKGLFLSTALKGQSIYHIHAHWASTTATMAYVIARVTGIPWSFTAHRWDITENNLLEEKCRTASFVRVISEKGRKEILSIIKDKSLAEKIFMIHMGVVIPEIHHSSFALPAVFTVLCPANIVRVKGHKYLLEACRILSKNSIKFKFIIAGDGPLEGELKKICKDLGLDQYMEFLGRLQHENLLKLYEKKEINTVVLPSIITDDGEMEGIPVALMEAMSFGIPVISTNTGGIPELIGDGSGIMVEEKNSEAIAGAIGRLMTDSAYYDSLCKRGREKIKKEYDKCFISDHLLDLFHKNSSKRNRENGSTVACSGEV